LTYMYVCVMYKIWVNPHTYETQCLRRDKRAVRASLCQLFPHLLGMMK